MYDGNPQFQIIKFSRVGQRCIYLQALRRNKLSPSRATKKIPSKQQIADRYNCQLAWLNLRNIGKYLSDYLA
jgi:hypothetical protein